MKEESRVLTRSSSGSSSVSSLTSYGEKEALKSILPESSGE